LATTAVAGSTPSGDTAVAQQGWQQHLQIKGNWRMK